MTGPQSHRIIIGSIATAGAVSAVKGFKHGSAPRLRILFGAFGAGIVLSMVSEFSPDLAAGLALVALVSSVLSSGSVLLDFTSLLNRNQPTDSAGNPIVGDSPVATPVLMQPHYAN